MPIKLIGSILVLVGCASIGFCIASMHNREIYMLENLCSILIYMINELQFRMTPLPELCMAAANQSRGTFQSLFARLATELEGQISPDAESCMLAALSAVAMPQHAHECLLLLGKNLGKFDIEGQINGIEDVRAKCMSKLEMLNNNKENRIRSYRTLGICAGLAIVIIFI